MHTATLYPWVRFFVNKKLPAGHLPRGNWVASFWTMDKYERRRLRLLALRDERCDGKSAVLARKIEREASYVTRMLYPEGKAGRKRISDDMMEIIEKAFDLPRGWLDQTEYTPEAPHVATAGEHAELISAWDMLLESEQADFLRQIKARAAHNEAVMKQMAVKRRTVVVSDRRQKTVGIAFRDRRRNTGNA